MTHQTYTVLKEKEYCRLDELDTCSFAFNGFCTSVWRVGKDLGRERESFEDSVLESGAVNTQYPVGFLEGKMAKLACIPVTMFSLIVFVIVFLCTGANEVEAQAPGAGSLPDNEGTFCLYIYLYVILVIKLKFMELEISIFA